MTKKKDKKTGTYEWAPKTINLQTGCENNCQYCYAKKMAYRYGRTPPEGWDHPVLKDRTKLLKSLPRQKLVMFPSAHDITPGNVGGAIWLIGQLLEKENQVLIVSKPWRACIDYLLQHFTSAKYGSRLEFRFTIGTMYETLAKEWEPSASDPPERMECVKMVIAAGFKCSISMEPLLTNSQGEIDFMVKAFVKSGVSEIWIGAMNYMHGAPRIDYAAIYETFKHIPQVKWKESFRKHLKPFGNITVNCRA